MNRNESGGQRQSKAFSSLIEEKGIGAAMIRNIYSFTYFTGSPWWQHGARKRGAESVLVYVNVGKPRLHAHPRNKEVKIGDTVIVDVMPSYRRYFSDLAHTSS